MTLFTEIKDFLKRFITNPLVLIAIAYILYKMIKERTGRKTESLEGLKVTHEPDGTDLVKDEESGAVFEVKGTSFKFLNSYQEKIADIKESLTEAEKADGGNIRIDGYLAMPLDDLVDEHKKLVGVLKKDDPIEIKKMLEDQTKELEDYIKLKQEA